MLPQFHLAGNYHLVAFKSQGQVPDAASCASEVCSGQCPLPQFAGFLRECHCPLPLLGRKRCVATSVHPLSPGPQERGISKFASLGWSCTSREPGQGRCVPLLRGAVSTVPFHTPEPFHDIPRREPCHSGRWAPRIQTTPYVFINMKPSHTLHSPNKHPAAPGPGAAQVVGIPG